jgi:hypothetical protein
MIYHSVGCTLKDKPKSKLFYSQEVPQLGGRSALIGNLNIIKVKEEMHKGKIIVVIAFDSESDAE